MILLGLRASIGVTLSYSSCPFLCALGLTMGQSCHDWGILDDVTGTITWVVPQTNDFQDLHVYMALLPTRQLCFSDVWGVVGICILHSDQYYQIQVPEVNSFFHLCYQAPTYLPGIFYGGFLFFCLFLSIFFLPESLRMRLDQGWGTPMSRMRLLYVSLFHRLHGLQCDHQKSAS